MTNETQGLLKIYRKYPCRTLPNAFWKTPIDKPGARLSFLWDTDGQLAALAVWQKNRLMAFWCTDPQAPLLTPQQAAQTPFALVHQNGLPIFDQHRFSRKSPYFRLSHSGRPPEVTCPPHFCCQAFEPQADIKQAENLIQTCYPNTAVDADSIRMWLDRPVYHPGLWVWAAHVHSGEKVGLGIAEYDPVVPEVSLEWLQVHPRFQGKDLGKRWSAN